MKKNPVFYLIGLLILLMSLAACGSEEPTPFPPTAVSEGAEVTEESQEHDMKTMKGHK